MASKTLNPAYSDMNPDQVKRFKYWEFRTLQCVS